MLLDTDADLAGRWHLAPQTGVDLIRHLERTRTAAGKSGRGDEYAGNHLSPEMLAELRDAVPCEDGLHRVVRLGTDPRAANATYAGAPLWHRTSPITISL